MKQFFRSTIAAIGAASLLLSSLPAAEVFAEPASGNSSGWWQDDEIYTVKGSVEGQLFYYRVVDEGAVITGFEGQYKGSVVTLPAAVVGMSVVGVDDFVFEDITGRTSFVVPDTLMLEYIGSEAFMTSSVVSALPKGTAIKEIVRMLVNDLAGLDYTDDEIADAALRLWSRIGDIPASGSAEQIILAIIKEIIAGNCGFTQESASRMSIAVSALSYENVTLKTSSEKNADKIDILTYAKGKTNMKCDLYVPSKSIRGDTNLNGRLDPLDAILIAKFLLGYPLTGEQQIAGDYNRNGKIDLQDAIGISKAILN